MLEVTAPGRPYAGRLGALPVPHLDQVAEQGAGPVSGGFVPVVTVGDRYGDQLDGVVPSADGQLPRWQSFCIMMDVSATHRKTGRKPSSGRACTRV